MLEAEKAARQAAHRCCRLHRQRERQRTPCWAQIEALPSRPAPCLLSWRCPAGWLPVHRTIAHPLSSKLVTCRMSVCYVAMPASGALLRPLVQDWSAKQAPSMTACTEAHLLCSTGLEAIEPIRVVQVAHIAADLHQLL